MSTHLHRMAVQAKTADSTALSVELVAATPGAPKAETPEQDDIISELLAELRPDSLKLPPFERKLAHRDMRSFIKYAVKERFEMFRPKS